jgi:hypothetical protein
MHYMSGELRLRPHRRQVRPCEIEPGEILVVNQNGLTSYKPFKPNGPTITASSSSSTSRDPTVIYVRQDRCTA